MNIGYWLRHGASSIWERGQFDTLPWLRRLKKSMRVPAMLEPGPGAREVHRYRISVSAILSN